MWLKLFTDWKYFVCSLMIILVINSQPVLEKWSTFHRFAFDEFLIRSIDPKQNTKRNSKFVQTWNSKQAGFWSGKEQAIKNYSQDGLLLSFTKPIYKLGQTEHSNFFSYRIFPQNFLKFFAKVFEKTSPPSPSQVFLALRHQHARRSSGSSGSFGSSGCSGSSGSSGITGSSVMAWCRWVIIVVMKCRWNCKKERKYLDHSIFLLRLKANKQLVNVKL